MHDGHLWRDRTAKCFVGLHCLLHGQQRSVTRINFPTRNCCAHNMKGLSPRRSWAVDFGFTSTPGSLLLQLAVLRLENFVLSPAEDGTTHVLCLIQGNRAEWLLITTLMTSCPRKACRAALLAEPCIASLHLNTFYSACGCIRVTLTSPSCIRSKDFRVP